MSDVLYTFDLPKGVVFKAKGKIFVATDLREMLDKYNWDFNAFLQEVKDYMLEKEWTRIKATITENHVLAYKAILNYGDSREKLLDVLISKFQQQV